MAHKSKGFTISEMMVTMAVIAIFLAVTIPLITLQKFYATSDRDVYKCIVTESSTTSTAVVPSTSTPYGYPALSTLSTSCQKAVNKCENGQGNACSALKFLANNTLLFSSTVNTNALKVTDYVCSHEGAKDACKILVDRCINNLGKCNVDGYNYYTDNTEASVDTSNEKPYDVNHYLTMLANRTDYGKLIMFNLLQEKLLLGVGNIVDAVINACTFTLSNGKTDNVAWQIIRHKAYNFDSGEAASFGNPSTVIFDGQAYLKETSDSTYNDPCKLTDAIGTLESDGTIKVANWDPVAGTTCSSGDNCYAMCTSTADLSGNYLWNNGTTNWSVTGATSISDGLTNTNTLAGLSDSGSPYAAAEACHNYNENGYSNWYLPSKDELNQLYINQNEGSLSGTTNTGVCRYWTSTEDSSSTAWDHCFFFGTQTAEDKHADAGTTLGSGCNGRYVRCFRRGETGSADNPCKLADAAGTVESDGTLKVGNMDTVAGGSCSNGATCTALCVASADEPGTYKWQDDPLEKFEGVSNVIDGQTNTNTIVGLPTAAHPAAEACYNSTADGHDDWYLPSEWEMGMVLDPGKDGTADDPSLFGIPTWYGAVYWTSTEVDPASSGWQGDCGNTGYCAFYPSVGYFYNWQEADSDGYDKNEDAYVRCMRRGETGTGTSDALYDVGGVYDETDQLGLVKINPSDMSALDYHVYINHMASDAGVGNWVDHVAASSDGNHIYFNSWNDSKDFQWIGGFSTDGTLKWVMSINEGGVQYALTPQMMLYKEADGKDYLYLTYNTFVGDSGNAVFTVVKIDPEVLNANPADTAVGSGHGIVWAKRLYSPNLYSDYGGVFATPNSDPPYMDNEYMTIGNEGGKDYLYLIAEVEGGYFSMAVFKIDLSLANANNRNSIVAGWPHSYIQTDDNFADFWQYLYPLSISYNNGHVFIGGAITDEYSYSPTKFRFGDFVMSIDTTGTIAWQRTFYYSGDTNTNVNSSNFEHPYHMLVSKLDNYIYGSHEYDDSNGYYGFFKMNQTQSDPNTGSTQLIRQYDNFTYEQSATWHFDNAPLPSDCNGGFGCGPDSSGNVDSAVIGTDITSHFAAASPQPTLGVWGIGDFPPTSPSGNFGMASYSTLDPFADGWQYKYGVQPGARGFYGEDTDNIYFQNGGYGAYWAFGKLNKSTGTSAAYAYYQAANPAGGATPVILSSNPQYVGSGSGGESGGGGETTLTSTTIKTSDSNNVTDVISKILKTTITQTTDDGTDIRYLVSFDGRSTWKKYSWGNWSTNVSLANIATQGNSATEIQNGLRNLDMTKNPSTNSYPNSRGVNGNKLDIAIYLYTPDGTHTPYLDKIDIWYY